MDNLHKLSSKLINENQVVCIESLKVKDMSRNPKLSKHIADVRQLTYKAEWPGLHWSPLTHFSRPQNAVVIVKLYWLREVGILALQGGEQSSGSMKTEALRGAE